MNPILASSKECTGCGACAASCSRGALLMSFDKNGFLVPKVDTSKCIGCGLCEKRCPIINENRLHYSNPEELENYTAWSLNEEICKSSSSGGVFSQIASNFLKKENTKVYGAYLTNHNTCYHVGISNVYDLKKIIGTKYIQSDASSSYKEVKEDLRTGKKVFYCGTPCQIAGLYSYLHFKEFDNLFTAELICHGVNSKMTADYASRFYNAKNIVSFRDKKNGWCLNNLRRVCFHCSYNGDGIIETTQNHDYYYRMFASTHRRSCYDCKFAHIERLADITLGDQWGLSDMLKDRQLLGASLVLCNTKKGKRMIENSENLYTQLNPNRTLNAYPLFAPAVHRLMNIGRFFFVLNKLPLSITKSILLGEWKKNWLVIPIVVLNVLLDKLQMRIINRRILDARCKYCWK